MGVMVNTGGQWTLVGLKAGVMVDTGVCEGGGHGGNWWAVDTAGRGGGGHGGHWWAVDTGGHESGVGGHGRRGWARGWG